MRAPCQAIVNLEPAPPPGGNIPGLAAVIVSNDPTSTMYVSKKIKACAEPGLNYKYIELGSGFSKAALLVKIAALNSDPKIHASLCNCRYPMHKKSSRRSTLI